MTKTTSINIVCKGNTTRSVTGKVAVFQIGDQKIKFFIQENGLRGISLTHFASGQTVANCDRIRSIKLESYQAGKVFTDRAACREALCQIEKRYGLTRLMVTMSSAPIINK